MIEYLGEVEGVRPMIAHSAVFVVSLYCKGLPRSSLEAMSMAMPMVTTDDSGRRETDAVARMGVASRGRVLARFSAARVDARILVVLRECLE
jgi:hypothetical protein